MTWVKRPLRLITQPQPRISNTTITSPFSTEAKSGRPGAAVAAITGNARQLPAVVKSAAHTCAVRLIRR
jgi:hypothetical protein